MLHRLIHPPHRDFTAAHKQPSDATEAAVQWLLREYYRRSLGLMLSDDKVAVLTTHGFTGLPYAVRQKVATDGQPLQNGPPWKAFADRHIQWATQQARRRLPTKTPESSPFRAEVQGWMKRAMNEQSQGDFVEAVRAITDRKG